ncbi:hypothetical protein CEXT_578581 [Caerostris extrusa]|uniref:Uncharacterized protein n=1 Tax=Caerostris extrusa TaxID=172846 RepID=A0AAV4S532_CAEEX|nr:hypothetical protein CEXT_578581 [Caerostris extrusa]
MHSFSTGFDGCIKPPCSNHDALAFGRNHLESMNCYEPNTSFVKFRGSDFSSADKLLRSGGNKSCRPTSTLSDGQMEKQWLECTVEELLYASSGNKVVYGVEYVNVLARLFNWLHKVFSTEQWNEKFCLSVPSFRLSLRVDGSTFFTLSTRALCDVYLRST